MEGLVDLKLDLGALDRARAILRNPDLRPAFKESRRPVRQDQRDHAKAQSGPGGKWAPRSSATKAKSGGRTYQKGRGLYGVRRRARRARSLLGRLPTALSARAERSRMIVSSLVDWSLVHWKGGRAGHGARIPERVFLWVSDRATETVAGIVAKHVARVLEGGR